MFDRHRLRVYCLGRRIHHGAVGAILTGLGLALALHDRRDFPWRPARELRKGG
jgi:hypothetical protein